LALLLIKNKKKKDYEKNGNIMTTMKELKMECGTIISYLYESLNDVHVIHVEDIEAAGTIIEDSHVICQSRINIRAAALPEIIKFLQEIQQMAETKNDMAVMIEDDCNDCK